MAATDEEEECCAICFRQGPFIELPCACRISYCSECWDRALAASLRARGRAQCPSCRAELRADYDPGRGGLVFSRDSEGVVWDQWRIDLYRKTRPVQIGLLRSFGASLPLRSGGGPGDGQGGDAKSSSSSSTSLAAEADQRAGAGELPLCVCGAHLERMSVKDRILRMLDEADSTLAGRMDEADALALSTLVTCDICGRVATKTGALWTCSRGTQTMMHPVSYDICEHCFNRSAGRAAASICGGRRKQESTCLPFQEESAVYSQSCGLSLLSALPWRWCGQATAASTPRASRGSARGSSGFVETIMLGTC